MNLLVSAASNNQTLIPAANLVLGGTGSGRTLTITPAAGQTGSATITVTIADAGGLTAADTFVVTVTAPNLPPMITSIANQRLLVGATVAALPFTIGDDLTPANSLQVVAESSNTLLLPLSGILVGGTGANRTVQLTPQAGQIGTTTITLRVTDGNLAATTTSFTLTVNALPNTPPDAVADTYLVYARNPLRGNVLFNDTDAEGAPLSASVSEPSAGLELGERNALTVTIVDNDQPVTGPVTMVGDTLIVNGTDASDRILIYASRGVSVRMNNRLY